MVQLLVGGWVWGRGRGGMGIQQHPATNKGEKTEQQAADKRYSRREEEERLSKDEGHKIRDLFCVRHSWPALSLSLSLLLLLLGLQLLLLLPY
jgi:hypothetical protein